jgi:hypothetical protein
MEDTREAKENPITLLAVSELGNFLPTRKKRFKQSLTPDSGQTLVDNNMPKTWTFKSATLPNQWRMHGSKNLMHAEDEEECCHHSSSC